ncbi:MAG TPA: VOC family protein [Blastocatellia bacterium]|nr:VOC family protein [Blastocatellia bacterium]
MNNEEMIPAKVSLDHLILGASDLNQAIAWFEKATGVKPVIGGVHPGRGTRNALVSLGDRHYLEILAPDPAQQGVSLKYDLKSLTTPRLIHWVAVANDVNLVVEKARAAGLNPVGPRDGSRARPDGRMLKWSSLDVVNNESVTLIPFFIQWAADSSHPSKDSPAGCELQSFEMESPHPGSVINILEAFGIKAEVKQAKEARLRATLKTPNGKVELS